MSKNLLRIILLTLIYVVTISFSSAQSLKDNPDYRNSLKLKRESVAAFEDGNYEESTKLANESIIYAQKSDEWITMMLNKYKANSALKIVVKRLRTAKKLNGSINFPEAMTEGQTLYDEANQLYIDKSYLESYPIALKAFDVLKVIEYVATKSALPAAYVVMDIPGNEDCLWNIAEYEFIFGDALQWELIYEANRDILPQPKNPNLIVAGLVLKIPSLNGEIRDGTWINGSIQ